MQGLNLSADQYRQYLETIASTHERKITTHVLTNEHKVVTAFSGERLMDGQVDAKAVIKSGDSIEVSRTLSIKLLDPNRSLGFDSDSPDDGSIYLDRMIRIIVSVRCPFGWVDVPVFTGPINKVDRDQDVISVEAQGKEAFGMGSAWSSYTYKGSKWAALRGLLTRAGEDSAHMDLPPYSKVKLVSPVVIQRETRLWPKAFGVAASMGRILFYDGRGVARTPVRGTKSVLTFRGGDGGLLMSVPQVTYSTNDMKNAVVVRGGKPKGKKRAVSAVVIAPRSHSLYPFRIGRNGWGRFFALTEENTDIRTKAKAVARANSLLRSSLLQGTEVSFDSLPVWHLDPWDFITVSTDRATVTARARSFSLPLMPDRLMSVGYQKNLLKPQRIPRRA